MRVVLFLSLAAVLLASVAFAVPSWIGRPAYDPEDINKRGMEIYESFMDWKRSLPSDSDGSFHAFQRSLQQRELSADLKDGTKTPLTENEQSESPVEEDQISEPDPPKIAQDSLENQKPKETEDKKEPEDKEEPEDKKEPEDQEEPEDKEESEDQEEPEDKEETEDKEELEDTDGNNRQAAYERWGSKIGEYYRNKYGNENDVNNERQLAEVQQFPSDEQPAMSRREESAGTGSRPMNTCRKIKASNPNAPSGKYIITPSSETREKFEVYCEMGLNGGGYTFLSPAALSKLTRSDLAEMFTDKSTFLMRIRRTDGTQPYAVLKQLPQYSSIPLKLGLSENTGYKAPVNINNLGSPFLFFGFLPITHASNSDVQGLLMNGNPVTFRNCDRNPNSHITIFPDFSESVPSTYSAGGPLHGPIFTNVRPNPSSRVMPAEYFMFAESHWGGCGCYVQTNQVPGVLGLSIGFK